MNRTLITFENLIPRTEIEIRGRIVEVWLDGGEVIYRGKVDDIQWGNNYPECIFWSQPQEWNHKKESWRRSRQISHGWWPDDIEHFLGPVEDEMGMISFLGRDLNYITLYPPGTEPPHTPRPLSACVELQKRLLRGEL